MNKRLLLPASFLALLFVGRASVSRTPAVEHASLVSEVLATYTPELVQRTPTARADAASAFLDSLDDALRSQAALALDDPERRLWTNVPPRGDEGGLRLGDCERAQIERACDLLASTLSVQGYAKVRDIMLADDLLLRGGSRRGGFGAENFWLAVFGSPSREGNWALQLDGHHVGLNLTFAGEEMTMSPSFVGTQPAAFERDGESVEPLEAGVADAFALVSSLTDEQRAQAVVAEQRGRIAAGAGKDGFVPDPTGLSCAELDDEQRALLRRLLTQFVGDSPASHAEARMRELTDTIDEMWFAWSGPTDHPNDVSYAIQGPTLILEYACQDLGGNPLDHLHSIYRNPTNEYGAALGEGR